MVKLLTRAGKHTGRYLVLATLTATLVACGGGSGDTVPLDEQDFDNDGELNGVDLDADGDGILDANDPSVDLDSDGFDDVIGEQDLDGDLIPNKDDPDADGDGLDDFAQIDGERIDTFIDLNQDGLDDATGEPEQAPIVFTPVSASAVCGSEPGSDNNSSDADWGNNCWIRRENRREDGGVEGQFQNSLYTVGVQRIVFCAGFDGGSGVSYAEFTDGDFGPNTEAALKAFQASQPNPQTDDGEVGPATWAKLRAAITVLDGGQQQVNGSADVKDAYGFPAGPCAGTTLFYQDVLFDTVSQSFSESGWTLAKNPPNTAQSAPFSVASPVGQLD